MADADPAQPKKKLYRKAVGSKLKWWLYVVFGLFAVLGVNSVYLAAITFAQWLKGETFENYFYQLMFAGHLVLGLLITVPVIVFGVVHTLNTYDRPNRRAVIAGYALLTTALLLLLTGFLLMRVDIGGVKLEVGSPTARDVFYWAHVITPVLVAWLFVLHRLAGRKIKWKIGVAWMAVSAAFALVMVGLHSQDPKKWGVVGPKEGEQYFFPSLARTATGNFIPAQSLMNDEYCKQCHADVYDSWYHSAHRFASFNNPAYLFSVRQTRKVALERDGNVQAARFCAGCHDVVPFFSGAFDDPNFDDVNHPTAQAGITCTACHAITNVNSTQGNSDFTIEEPSQYPFTFSESPFLRWVNRQLVKAKPAFHKKTFLKPLHKTTEYCGACHKVHLPEELNKYKWLRGQNLYDDFLLSGVSGHGTQSFYYPPKAEPNCNNCHMKLVASDDFGARERDESGELKVHNHQFPSANTAISVFADAPESLATHEKFNEGVMRVDLFALRQGGTLEGELAAPLRPETPALQPGQSYLFDAVVRTVKMGHNFTGGTSDSNEMWLDVVVKSGTRVIGRSGARAADGQVDPWSHFLNVYMLDRNGERIDRRNAQDIFVPLYDHQIPPGAADVVHYRFDVPPDVSEPITIEVALRYRKFDTTYVRLFQGDEFKGNDFHIMELAKDALTLPVAGAALGEQKSAIDPWQRWNDYGIGLLRKAGATGPAGELRQAEVAFKKVEELGRAEGPLNLARVYLREGRLDEAAAALKRAGEHQPPAYAWSLLWFGGMVSKQNGFLDEAVASFKKLDTLDTEETRKRGFDFSKDYRMLNELGQTLVELAKEQRGDENHAAREALLREAQTYFERTLAIDSENLSAHYNLSLILGDLGQTQLAEEHRKLHEKYKPDDNARDRAVTIARRNNPAANHAAEAVVIYDLQRAGTFDLPDAPPPKGGKQ
ncbi:MAG: tetratricopeptide repeat protein [Planctomycetes bacterium]|nr:tetratricopeptide repeat protein [Planctomycetota bacterium]